MLKGHAHFNGLARKEAQVPWATKIDRFSGGCILQVKFSLPDLIAAKVFEFDLEYGEEGFVAVDQF